MERLNLKTLRSIAKRLELREYSRMRKSQLIDFIVAGLDSRRSAPPPPPPPPPRKRPPKPTKRPPPPVEGWRYQRDINLMLISEDDRWHHTAIKSLSRLLTSRNSKHHGKQHFALIAYRVLHQNRAEMSIMLTVLITKPLEWRCLARDPQ